MRILNTIKEILKLPKVKIEIIDVDETNEVRNLYLYFNQRHKKYKIIKNKTVGVMLYELPKDIELYNKEISGKNSVSYFSRRCKKFGYYTKFFEQEKYLDELYEINTSSIERQGHKMSEQYLKKVEAEPKKDSVKYFGVFTKEDKLVAYIKLVVTPKLFNISKLLGHKEYLNDNIMYLLLHDLTVNLIEEGKDVEYSQYLMYDTYFGASNGIKLYKKRNCFKPYKVKWKYIDKKNN